MPTHYEKRERGSSLLAGQPADERGISTVTGEPVEQQTERQTRGGQRAASVLAGVGELGLHMAPGSGDVLAAKYSRELGAAGMESLRQGEYRQAAGQFAESVAHGVGAVPAIPPLFTGVMAGKRALGNLALVVKDPAYTRASTAQKTALKMEQVDKATPGQIWQETGWYRDQDKLWRFEIDDTKASLTKDFKVAKEYLNSVMRVGGQPTNTQRLTLDQVFDHPELFKHYPSLSKMEVRLDPSLSKNTKGEFIEELDLIKINPRMGYDDIRKTLLHEIQHHVQGVEGFAQGGNPQTAGIYAQRLLGHARVKKEASEAVDDVIWRAGSRLELINKNRDSVRALAYELKQNPDGSYQLTSQGSALLDQVMRSRDLSQREANELAVYAAALKQGKLAAYEKRLGKDYQAGLDLQRALSRGTEEDVAMALYKTGESDKYYHRLAGEAEARLVEARSTGSGTGRFPLLPNYHMQATGTSPESRLFVSPSERYRGPGRP